VDSCPTKAIKFAEESELAELIAQGQVMKPEAGTKPRVYYLNIPKKFVAGTVYDPKEKEVVIGATCTLTPAAGGAALTVATDEFGDFWFNDIDAGTYALSIKADGFDVKAYDAVDAADDVNLGDIALSS
jgi:hypothetical protein